MYCQRAFVIRWKLKNNPNDVIFKAPEHGEMEIVPLKEGKARAMDAKGMKFSKYNCRSSLLFFSCPFFFLFFFFLNIYTRYMFMINTFTYLVTVEWTYMRSLDKN